MLILPLVESKSTPKILILIKESAAKPSSVLTGYHSFINEACTELYSVAPLYYAPNNKVTAKDAKSYILDALPVICLNGFEHLYVADSTYFKILTGKTKSDPWRGYNLPCVIKGYEHLNIVLGYNHNVLFHNPNYEGHIRDSIKLIESLVSGQSLQKKQFTYTEHRVVNMTLDQSKWWTEFLLKKDILSIDLEGFSLKFYDTGLATVSIAWSSTEALTFNIDMGTNFKDKNCVFRRNIPFNFLRFILFHFTGKWILHNASFDLKVFIFELFMNRDFFDYEGMIYGIEQLTANFEDTKLIYYCCTNNAVKNTLSLKEIAHEYVGNYAQESIDDVTQIPLPTLLNYNGVDAVATFWVYEKYYPIMIAENQLDVYENILKKSVRKYLQAELVGLPLSIDRVLEAIEICEANRTEAIRKIMSNPIMTDYAEQKAVEAYDNQHLKWKKKRETLDYFRKEFDFNPNSNQQAADFLYEYIGFEPIEFTDTGAPSTSKDALAPLKYQTDDALLLEILKGFEELSEVAIILNNFLTTFRDDSILKSDGVYWIHGNHNIGGTKSGRLSSSDPNLQNMPSAGKYGKLIKSCVVAPKGWLFCGADFSSLEDRADALLTKDTNKIKVYTDGFDGHCLRAYFYFKDKMKDIDGNSVDSINSIKDLYPIYRQDSKAPTFALTYLGTWITLVKNCGFSKEQAKQIEASYHELYIESDNYKNARLKQAAEDGFAYLAFGLKIRCKLLASSMFGTKYMTSAAKAEMRTIGNAFGQSYGMLNNRAGIAFQETCFNHPKYRLDVMPVMDIHDAQYYLIRDDIDVLYFANTEIVKEMSWQELPEIQHDLVKLGAELDVFFPSWEKKVTIPNHATKEEILMLAESLYD